MKKILIVGAGFSGAVLARELAEKNYQITIIDKRDHIGGNAYDYLNEHNIRIHKYGPHLFHTSNTKVIQWLSKFTEWTPYKHKVKAMLSDGRLVTLPVNKETADIVGENKLIDTFYRPYTQKMWGMSLEDVDSSILSRVPIRDDLNEYYFPNDDFQALPTEGYSNLFEKILAHPNIKVKLKRAYIKGEDSEYYHTFNSMPIDEYFDFKLGHLPYRSIRFHTSTAMIPQLFPVTTVNFTHDGPCTRVTEWKNLPNSYNPKFCTTFTIEEPCDYTENNFERYYPVKDKNGYNRELYKRYSNLASTTMTFIGRCGLYAYLDMHQAINSALEISKKFAQENQISINENKKQ